MSLVRVLKSSRVTLTHVFEVDGAATDADAGVTVHVRRLDGSDADGTPTGSATHQSTGTYTWTLSPSAFLDTWTVDWSGAFGGAAVTVTDYVEIVGGFYFDLARTRSAFQIKPQVSTQDLADYRTAVEQECDDITMRSFVPRFARVKLSGNGRTLLDAGRRDLRDVRAVSVDGVAWDQDTVDAVGCLDDGTLARPGALVWPAGWGNIIVEFEYGQDYPPPSLSLACQTRLRSVLNRPGSGVPDRATSFTTPDGGVYRLSTPDRQHTGIPDVDAEYARHTRPRRAVVA